jgi:hypothetical protein
MADDPIKMQCKDFEGRDVVFAQDNFIRHTRKHPELEQTSFFPKHVMHALQNPTHVVGGYHNNTRCYYFTIFKKGDIILYAKVVVATNITVIDGKEVYCIKTAHKTDHIQETKYGYKVQ